jgi:hypothetical protein
VGFDRLADNPSHVTAITEAFGALRLGGTALEVCQACDAADEYLRKILDSPGVSKQYIPPVYYNGY